MSADTTKGGYFEPAPGIAVVGRQNGKTAKMIATAVEAARPVHYREAAASLRVLLDGLLPIDDRTMGLRYAATRLERTADDMDDDTAAALDRAHNHGERRNG